MNESDEVRDGTQPFGQTRIGDVEREQAAKLIVAAVGSGHLDVEEADRRIAQVYQARWPSDLATLMSDLPSAQQPRMQPPPPPQSIPPRRPGNALPVLPILLLAFGTFIVLGHLVGPWAFPAVPILLGMLLLMRWRVNHTT